MTNYFSSDGGGSGESCCYDCEPCKGKGWYYYAIPIEDIYLPAYHKCDSCAGEGYHEMSEEDIEFENWIRKGESREY